MVINLCTGESQRQEALVQWKNIMELISMELNFNEINLAGVRTALIISKKALIS